MSDRNIEMKHLNLDDLDVEELEHRLEMAMAAPDQPNAGCPNDATCYINIPEAEN